MSVWASGASSQPSLCGSEGALVSVSVHAEPRYLEELLDGLSQLKFPINPQIYHDAAVIYRYEDGREELEATTIVEFPAYEARIPEVRRMLQAYGFAPDSLHVTEMLNDMHGDAQWEPAPAGAGYQARKRCKHGLARVTSGSGSAISYE